MVVSFANRKGGVGKTTTAFNLGYTLALTGSSVLFVDLDSQCNLTLINGLEPISMEKWKEASPIYLNAKVSILAGTQFFNQLENEINNLIDRNTYLKNELLPKIQGYDYVIIDTPPSLSFLNVNAFVISNKVLIVVNPDYFSLSGLVQMREILEQVIPINPRLEWEIVVNGYTGKQRKYNRDFMPALENQPDFSGVLIPQRQHFIDMSARHQPAIDNDEILEAFQQLVAVLKK